MAARSNRLLPLLVAVVLLTGAACTETTGARVGEGAPEPFPSPAGVYGARLAATPRSGAVVQDTVDKSGVFPEEWGAMSLQNLWERYTPLALSTLPVTVLALFPNEYLVPIVDAEPGILLTLPTARLVQLPGSVLSNLSRDVDLVLAQDGAAILTLRFTQRPDSLVERGTWRQSGFAAVVLLTEAEGQPIRDELVFNVAGDHMVASDWNRGNWGVAALQLTRR